MIDEAERNRRHAAERSRVQAERAVMMQDKTQTGGLLLLHTGDGKGKSTAGFGMVARALGWGMRVGVVQFIKGKWVTGERRFFARFPDQLRFEVMGDGFTWNTQDCARDIAAAQAAWVKSQEMIADPTLDFVLLDELNVALRYEYLDLEHVLAVLRERPRDKHVCVTGRDAKPGMVELAELVTEMRLVKHPFSQGMKAQRGVDF